MKINNLFENVEVIKLNKYKTHEDKFFIEIKYNNKTVTETMKCYINQTCFDIIIVNNKDMYITGYIASMPETIVIPSSIQKVNIPLKGELTEIKIPPQEQILSIPYLIIDNITLRD